MDEIDAIKQAMTALEAQRSVLGDAVVETAMAPLREKLALLQPRPASEQRKLVTILFADVVGFTAMSEHMDPEDVREIINAYFTRWTTSIERFGGVVEKFIGDAVMAVFGLTISHEEDPESAVRAALEMLQNLAELNSQLDVSWGIKLEMRVGIHTGTVMVSLLGERKGQDFVVVGDTVNLASRLQSVAPSGGILISQDTYRHVGGSFEVQILSPIRVKGKEEPVQAYQVMQAKRRSFRITRGVEGIRTPMVGRETELAQLKEALKSVSEHPNRQVITVIGEAGIGKSRLIAEFDDWIELLPYKKRYFKARANPSTQNLPYSLLREVFTFSFQINDSDPPQAVQAKLERGVGEFEYGDPQVPPETSDPGITEGGARPGTLRRAHFIGQLLGFRFEHSPYLHQALQDARNFWEQAVTYLIDYFKALTSAEPVVLLLEDMHWADDNSLEILTRVVEGLSRKPLLAVCTARPYFFEHNTTWGQDNSGTGEIYTTIHLNSLTQQNSRQLVEQILQKIVELPESLRELIVNKAEGNPFYIEELIKMLIEEQVILKEDPGWRVDFSRLEGVPIPSTLVEVLQARLDSLSLEERVLLQRASVIGRIFWDEALNYMERGQEDQAQISPQLISLLADLSAREMVFSQRISTFQDTHEFIFKHALLRDVTYENVLKRMRKIYHGYAAAWLETITERSQRSGEYAGLIAEHYSQAGNHEKARDWYEQAANLAVDTYANAEGIRCLTRCLELTPEEDMEGKFDLLLKRLRLHDTLSNRQAQKEDLESLQALAEKLDEKKATEEQPHVSRRARASLQWWFFYEATGDIRTAEASAQQAIALAQVHGDKESETSGYLYLGATYWRQSDYAQAQENLEKSLELARAIQARHIEADALRNLAVCLHSQNKLSPAQNRYEQATQIYREIKSERGEGMVLNSLGVLIMNQGKYREALQYFERSLELKRKIGHRRGEMITLNNLGTVSDYLGDFLAAQDHFEKVRQHAETTGDIDMEVDALNGLGNVAMHLGDLGSAEAYLEKAINLATTIDYKIYACAALISLGELAYQLGKSQAAMQYGQEALSIAQEINEPENQASSLALLAKAKLKLGQVDEADKLTHEAWELVRQQSSIQQKMEILTSMVMSELALKHQAQAIALVEQILDHLHILDQVGPDGSLTLNFSQLEGFNGPFYALLTCYRVLLAGQDHRAEPLLKAAHRLLLEQADRLPEGETRTRYLEAIDSHAELRRLYRQLEGGTNGESS